MKKLVLLSLYLSLSFLILININLPIKEKVFASSDKELVDGEITTVIGRALGDNGLALSANLTTDKIAVDSRGNIFISDIENYRIRKISAKTAIITTVAGNGQRCFDGEFCAIKDNTLATNAAFNQIMDIAIDSQDNLFVAEAANGNGRVYKVDMSTGLIRIVAGRNPKNIPGDGKLAINAIFMPESIAVDKEGNLFIGDRLTSTVREVDVKTGIIFRVAGNGEKEDCGLDGVATEVPLVDPTDLTFDLQGNLIIADFYAVRRLDFSANMLTIIAGDCCSSPGSSGDGGQALAATFNYISAIAFDKNGNLYISDVANMKIRRVDAESAIITTVAGDGYVDFIAFDGDQYRTGRFSGEGENATKASLNFPYSIAFDKNGNLLIADTNNLCVRKVNNKTEIITTIAGKGKSYREIVFNGEQEPIAALEGFFYPDGIVVDKSGNIFISDGNKIYFFDATTRLVRSYAGNGYTNDNGSGAFTGDGGLALEASLNKPESLVLDKEGNLFIADKANERVRRVDAQTKIITTVAGGGDSTDEDFIGDGLLATQARLKYPKAIALDKDENLFIVDTDGNRVRRVDAKTGIITTVAGNGKSGFSGDNVLAVNTSVYYPTDLVIDQIGNLFILDSGNYRIRKVDAVTGIITTVAGGKDFSENKVLGDGGLATNIYLEANGLTVDQAGNLFIADNRNNRIRRVDGQTGIITTVVGNGEFRYNGDNGLAINASLNKCGRLAIDRAGNLFIITVPGVRMVKGIARVN